MVYTHVSFNNDILSQNVTILHVVCVSEMLNLKRMCKYETRTPERKLTAYDI